MKSIGQWIAHHRRKRGWNLTELEHRTGISDSLIRRYESGRGEPNFRNLVRLARVFEESPDLLKIKPSIEHHYWEDRRRI